ncbi:MAG: NusG antitermination factor, transcriptional antiterminator NusG [Candidatus Wolfebacteria bacterium GW2011_GWC1_43_10]|uniref:Transcription termination/antitermination protein NusG n=2 Tax=Candidatus Wolfeibacteriota TaxID=1752735 RepID=A0A0G1F7N1_9BACT|nr:MAG: NusG antitermination factor, transcriptional antiterminator NusG [Candidatus Wolfebacteria bacterium GW2011_GWC1_43_10]KKT22374.1 MAG: Transcription antitermination protein nusG [Parcubacteria group bacterium GW2011_GWB1_43_8b]OGM90220.1 MAG: transcription termination/antitermination protein NusG [Candidatus Wolfebacteria bacterium GWA1_42_9]
MAEEKKRDLQVGDKERAQKRWYAIHTYSGYEDAVARYLAQRVESLSMNDKIFNIIVPKEKKIKIKGGKRKIAEEKIYPGYVLVEMNLTEDSWYVVRNTPRVMGFVGPDSTKPTPLSQEEIDYLMSRMKEDREMKFKVEYAVGDLVKIIDGPFKDYEGKISEVDEEHGRVKMSVPVFGRETVIEVDSLQIQKI